MNFYSGDDCIGFATIWLVWDPDFGLSRVLHIDPRLEDGWGAIAVEKVQKWVAARQGRVALHAIAGRGQG